MRTPVPVQAGPRAARRHRASAFFCIATEPPPRWSGCGAPWRSIAARCSSAGISRATRNTARGSSHRVSVFAAGSRQMALTEYDAPRHSTRRPDRREGPAAFERERARRIPPRPLQPRHRDHVERERAKASHGDGVQCRGLISVRRDRGAEQQQADGEPAVACAEPKKVRPAAQRPQPPASAARRLPTRAPSWLPATTASAKPNSISCACPAGESRPGSPLAIPVIESTDAGSTKTA